MSLAIVDVREWQNLLDLRTGKKRQDDSPVANMVQDVLRKHPYPGDVDCRSNQWVTDTALDLMTQYDPHFVFLSYAQQYFSMRYTELTAVEQAQMIDDVFAEVDRFSKATGFMTIVVGTGDMIPVVETIDFSRLDGLAVSSHWSTRYLGLHDISDRDKETIKNTAGIERVVSRAECSELFKGVPGDAQSLPDFLAVAKEGLCFKSPLLRQPVNIPSCNEVIPISANAGVVENITDLSACIAEHLQTQKVALVVVEGIGVKEFRQPYTTCTNGLEWFFYEAGSSQYLALSTGEHQFFTHPAGAKEYVTDNEDAEYPFSGYFTSIPEKTLGRNFAGKSIAVGNRSMFMHTVTGTDIAIECFARNLYNQGCLAVVHRADK